MHKFSKHELGVDKFYGIGVKNYKDFHGGYLNFGLWEKGVNNYLDAAENMVKHMGKLTGLNKNSHLLDVACGMGPDTILLHKTFNCKVTGVDVTRNHVIAAQKRVSKAKLNDKIKILYGSAVDLPFEDESFSQIISIEGPEHFDTREKFFKEALRVLKPGGVIGLCDYTLTKFPSKWWHHFLVNLTAKLWHVPKANFETAESYKKKMEKNGFVNVSYKLVGDKTIPGYYFENKRPETKRAIRNIRGWIAAYPGHIIDISVYYAFKFGLIEYLIISAEKPI